MDVELFRSYLEDRFGDIEYKQTHISHVFLTPDLVFKVKKPVNFGFLDFSTLEKRERFCNKEVELNSRLCPNLYLDVVPITESSSGTGYEIGGSCRTVEYAVRMRRIPEKSIMHHLIKSGNITTAHIKKIASVLTGFYSSQNPSERVLSFGRISEIKKLTDQNFSQTEEFIGKVFEKNRFDFIKKATDDFYERNKRLFESRVDDKRILEIHGDLHTGNIFIHDDIYIFDCIEFNEEFRCGDVASDIGFLSMDLDYLGQRHLSKYLISKFVAEYGDYTLFSVLDFYKCYRAYVRAKVIAFLLNDPAIPKNKHPEIIKQAKAYFDLAYGYAKVFDNTRPCLIIGCGFSASGKSRWMRIASDIINAPILRTDVIRRELFGLSGHEKKDDAFYKKYYSEDMKDKVYDEIFKRAEGILEKGGKVAIDASFHTAERRAAARIIAERHGAEFIIINTYAGDDTLKKRIIARSKDKSNVSDADVEHTLDFFRKNFEPPQDSEGDLIRINTEKKEEETIADLRKTLKNFLGISSYADA